LVHAPTPVRVVLGGADGVFGRGRFKQVEKLPAKERRQLLQLIDAFLEREKLRGNGSG